MYALLPATAGAAQEVQEAELPGADGRGARAVQYHWHRRLHGLTPTLHTFAFSFADMIVDSLRRCIELKMQDAHP